MQPINITQHRFKEFITTLESNSECVLIKMSVNTCFERPRVCLFVCFVSFRTNTGKIWFRQAI